MIRSLLIASVLFLGVGAVAVRADPPVASYIFPAGGQRGKTVNFKVGGLFLLDGCSFEMLGQGVKANKTVQRTKTVWFEGPFVPIPESQAAEDYPKDYAGQVRIAAGTPLGARYWRLWNAQGATPAMKFIVGDLPEVVEEEIDGDPIPVEVQLPVTINGRIFPREDVDIWSFKARRGETISGQVQAASLGSPLDSRLEVLDPRGRRLAENDDAAGADSFVRFTAPEDGTYQVRIHDVQFRGGQAFVYRLTLTTDPTVDWTYPLGGRRGSTVAFQLGWKDQVKGTGTRQETVSVPLPKDGPGDHVQRFPVGEKLSRPFLLELDDLPEYLEAEPNNEPSQAQSVSVPAILNGRIDKPGDVDYWSFTARKGDAYEFDLRAGRLGSPLAGVLVLLDAAGKELARADAAGANMTDPHVSFVTPAAGTYYARVQERFHSRGGPAYAYRLHVERPAAPDFRLRLGTDALALVRGGEAKLKVLAERVGGFKETIQLKIDGLPQGIAISGTILSAQQIATEVVFKDTPAVRVGGYRLTIRGTAVVGTRTIAHTATLPADRGVPELESVLLATTLATPFQIKGNYDFRWVPQGTVQHRHYRIERGSYTGPLEVSVADRQARHLQGVTGPNVTVPAGVNEFDFTIQMPSWMETGRTSRTCVCAVGVVQDADGKEHQVSFSSVQPNEQLTFVLEPGRLSVSTDRSSLLAVPAQSVSVPVRVARGKGLQGPVKLELIAPAHVRGILAEPASIPADQSSGHVLLHFAAGNLGPFNQALVVRATATYKGEPVIAETKVEVQAAR